MNKNIALVVVGLPLDKHFDYAVPESMQDKIEVGSRVRIMFARRKTIGYVIGFQSKSQFDRISSVLDVLDDQPIIDEVDIARSRQMRDYYGCSLGEAIEVGICAHLKKGRRGVVYPKSRRNIKKAQHTLLFGLSDSGTKWKKFNKVLENKIKNKQSVIVLVPEKQQIRKVAEQISTSVQKYIICADKKLKVAELDARAKRLNGNDPVIFIGTRASVFTNMTHLSLIVVFGEANVSYKEEQTPHYHAREIVLMRAELEGVDTLWISNLPSAELWYWAQERKWNIEELGLDTKKKIKVIDMMNYNPEKRLSLSIPVQNKIRTALDHKQQTVIIVNQRDFIPYEEEGGTKKRSKVERITFLIGCIYENTKVSTFGHNQKCDAKAPVIIATPTVVKEKWFNPDLVLVANFDTLINAFDFRSSHRAFQFANDLRIIPAEVFIQTFMADHYVLKAIKTGTYKNYYQEELKHRYELGYPPYNHLIAYSSRANDEEKLSSYMQEVYDMLYHNMPDDFEMIEPFPDNSSRLKEDFKYTLILKSKEVKSAVDFLKINIKSIKKPSRVIATIDVDP